MHISITVRTYVTRTNDSIVVAGQLPMSKNAHLTWPLTTAPDGSFNSVVPMQLLVVGTNANSALVMILGTDSGNAIPWKLANGRVHRLLDVLTRCGLICLRSVQTGRATNGRKPHARFTTIVNVEGHSLLALSIKLTDCNTFIMKFLLVRTRC